MFTKGPKYIEPKSINWNHNFRILMDFVEDYARQAAKREKRRTQILFPNGSLIQIRIKKLSGSMSTRSTSISKDPNVAKYLSAS